jgi:hypothetical protein
MRHAYNPHRLVPNRSSQPPPVSSGVFATVALHVGAGVVVGLTSGMRDEGLRSFLIALAGISSYIAGDSLERSLRAECRPCAMLLDAAQPILTSYNSGPLVYGSRRARSSESVYDAR